MNENIYNEVENIYSATAEYTAKYIQEVIIRFFSTTPLGIFLLILLIALIVMKFWNWGIRDRNRFTLKKIAHNQGVIYEQQTQILNELKRLNMNLGNNNRTPQQQYFPHNNNQHNNFRQ